MTADPQSVLAEAVAYALTGTWHTLAAGPLAEVLATAGVTAEVSRAEAARRMAIGQSWPLLVPADRRPGVSAAQLQACLYEVRREWGLLGDHQPRPQPRPLTDAERRLLRDVPPHHGT